MAWYYDIFRNKTAIKSFKVKTWKWNLDGICDFIYWADENNINCKFLHDIPYTTKLTFDNCKCTLVEDKSVLVYRPWRISNPFIAENLEDFHKNYLWHEEKNNEH